MYTQIHTIFQISFIISFLFLIPFTESEASVDNWFHNDGCQCDSSWKRHLPSETARRLLSRYSTVGLSNRKWARSGITLVLKP